MDGNEIDYSSIKLDRSRPFGTVHPPEDGAHFSQDGFHFGPDDSLAENWLTDADKKRLDRIFARKKADAAAEEARRNALAEAGFGEEEISAMTQAAKTVAPGAGGGDGEKFDLKAWGRGEINAPWFKVRKEFETQFGRAVDTAKTAVEFLVDENLIPADKARSV